MAKVSALFAILSIAGAARISRKNSADVCPNMQHGTPPDDTAEVPSKEAYDAAVEKLDMEAVKSDMSKLLKDSKECWPADFGNYGPFMVRLAWHCSGSFRKSDGAGGCGGGRMRFEPERSWPDNTNLDKARALLDPLKEKYGDALSWGDLFILAGTTALRDAGAPIKRMCFGRPDEPNGEASLALGPTALQAEQMPCEVNGECKPPLGATTVGLIYVNPEGPMANPVPELSAKDVRQTFEAMGHSDRNTVALVGGGHAIGKAHGACEKSPGLLPKDAFKKGEMPWMGECNSGKGNDTVTSGFEGAWTTNPLTWDNEYYKAMIGNEWEKHKGPGGHWQWRVKGGDKTGNNLMRLTADLALLHDEKYLAVVKEFAEDMDAFNEAFDDAWFDLTTVYGTRQWSEKAKCDDGDLPAKVREEADKYKKAAPMRGDDVKLSGV